MKLFGYTVVYNEETLVPYVLPYIERMGYDKFIVYDDGCKDNTIGLLSSGLTAAGIDFEIRPTLTIDEKHDFDGRKRTSHLFSIEECMKIAAETNESVWISFTDFDEVIYCSRERQKYLKEYLEMEDERGFNFFDGRMLQLSWDGKEKDERYLPHQWSGVKGAWWLSEGMKVTLFRVNDFEQYMVYCANHHLGVKPRDGVNVKSLAESGEFHGFHLKYFDAESFKTKDTRHYGRDPEEYLREIRSVSFPMDMYFLMKGFVTPPARPNKRDMGEGLFLM